MIYLVVFAISIYFAYLCTKIDWKEHKIKFILCALVSILAPSILAGFRATKIGTDINLYVVSDFKNAINYSNLIDFMNLGIYREKLYLLLVYVVARITNNISVLLFIIQLIIMTGIFYGGYKHREKASFPIIMLVFFLLFYNSSYNIVRQYLAMAIVFAGIIFLEKKKYVIFTFFVILASLFHTSALITLVLPVIFYFVNREDKKKSKINSYFIILFIFIICITFKPIVELLINIGIISQHYSAYISELGSNNTNIFTVLFSFEVIIIIVLYLKNLTTKINDYEFYKTNAIVLLILLQLSRIVYSGDRISTYFNIINVFLIAQIPNIFEKKENRLIIKSGILLISLSYWIYVYVIHNSAETYPYVSIFGNQFF